MVVLTIFRPYWSNLVITAATSVKFLTQNPCKAIKELKFSKHERTIKNRAVKNDRNKMSSNKRNGLVFIIASNDD